MEAILSFYDHKLRRWVFGSDPRLTLARVVVWAILTIVLFHHLLLPIKIIGSSMSPTYRDGSVNFINRLAYTRTEPKRGEVVAVYCANELLLKRIIGLPGEVIRIDDGRIEINGRPLRDEFASSRIASAPITLKLRDDQYFVIGDNRETSFFGRIYKREILGRIVF
jgi:signal peptidase I